MKNQTLNQLINLFWTILCFIPVYNFWADEGAGIWMYVFIVFSVIFGLLPTRIFRHFQLSRNKRFYERLGVKFIQKFVQDGTLVRKASRKNSSGQRIINNRAQAQKYLSTANGYERFHFMCLVFFLLSMTYAIIGYKFGMAVLILIANVIYNCFPILLQQYNRLRIRNILK